MARRPGPKSPIPETAPAPAPVRSSSLVDAYDVADLAPATKGLWPRRPHSGARPLVSIVVLSLDGAELLDRLLASFQQTNTYPAVEIVVVDHGSTDGSLELLRRWAGRLPVKIVARGANYGYSTSNNYGARLAAGELILFLNNDIVFTEDVLGEMVELIGDDRVGLVGLKQVQPALTPSGRRVYHLGVRFGWNVVERRLRPYHVRPGPLDARLSEEVAALPAVTASAMLCRAADFQAVGGFSEDYFYGLEDVDLCCRVRWRLGKAVVCLNSRSALHFKNSTRERDVESRRPTEKVNRRVLQARCGYGIRREFVRRRLDDDGSFTGARFTVGIAVDAATALEAAQSCDRAFGLGEALRGFGWDVRYLSSDAWASAAELDLYIAATAGPTPHALDGAAPHLTSVRWLAEGERPEPGDLSRWDLLLCPSARVLAGLDARDRARAIIFPPAVDPDTFVPGPARPGLECDYLIVGDCPARTRPKLADFDPDGETLNLRVRGEGWRGLEAFAPYAAGPAVRADLPRLYASAAVTVLDGALAGTAGPGQAILEVIASGGLPLSDDADAVAELFEHDLPVWRDAQSLGELLNRYCADADERRALADGLRRRVLEAHTWRERAGRLRQALQARVDACRVAIKAGGGDRSLASALELSLLQQGVPARVDEEADWWSVRSIADDVAIVLPGAAAYRPAPDQINLRVAAERRPAAGPDFDAAVGWSPTESGRRKPGGSAEALAAELIGLIEASDRIRSLGPTEAGAGPPQAVPSTPETETEDA